MREIISPFRKNQNKEPEDGDWKINPQRIKVSQQEENSLEYKPKKGLISNYIFNDSPENNYEGDKSPLRNILNNENNEEVS